MSFLLRCCWMPVLVLFSFAFCRPGLAQLKEAGTGAPGPVVAAHLTAELTAGAPTLSRGATTDIALVLHLDNGWHVYWRNAGDSGEPPQATWLLPKGLSAGEMQFATPSRLPLGPLMDYGYEGTAVFPFKLTAASTVAPGTAHLQAHVRWLVCREVCIPGKAFLGLDLPISQGAQPATSNPLILSAFKAEPVSLPAGSSVDAAATRDHITLTFVTGKHEATAEFYPLDENALHNAAEQKYEASTRGGQLTLERGETTDRLPATLRGVLKLSEGRAYDVNATVHALASSPTSASHGTDAKGVGLALALLLALGGGIVLNLMPCVFPVIFLKALALADSSSETRKRQRSHGFAYTAGVLLSFWSIVAVLLLLRAAGRQAGWGFQLQSPVFVVLLASLLFFMSLSLAGQFELGLTLTGSGDALTRKQGLGGSFFTGVLATVVATPCTAPLMGAAIGFALAQSAIISFAIFTALALGLALPYLALTLQPGWVKLLPKPGRWMETLKQVTAVPLLLTVVWLVWVYGRLFSSAPGESSDRIARLLVGLILLAVAGWVLSRWPARRTGAVAAVLVAMASLGVSLSAPQADTLHWQPFSAEAVQQAQAKGQPVFVDFTAAWCLSCQVNERAVLHDAQVEQALQQHHYVLLRADWTRYDPAITQELARVQRSGVPTYVVYSGKPEQAPRVLPELLTTALVLRAVS